MAYSLEKIKQDLLLTQPTFEQMNLNKISFAQEMEFAIQAFQNNSYLLGMEPDSVRNCLVNVALSGLTLNPIMKQCYLVPRKGKLCLDVGYMGLIKVVTDTGSVKSIKADVAYEKDTFDIELGSKGFVKHKPFLGGGSRGRKLGAYSIAVLNDGTEHIDFMLWDEIMAIKARSESVKSGKKSAWDTDEDEMACKTVIKRQYKYLPKSDRALMASHAIAFDDDANGIDFAKEKEEAERKTAGNSPAGATPEATPEALATDEDITSLRSLLEDPAMPDLVLGTANKNRVLKIINDRYGKDELTKSKSEEYISALTADLQTAKEAQIEGKPGSGITPNENA